ncbi:uncharacterized protein LOC113203417 [Frankliniella occidentalis]|uniref:Uncharacterized protein LOC113203417 n=1 Tax=Frankliniella occidentalis TaxID=133901 RepID=A0A9C6TZ76_FRAOC|nr:uncharacterized protein LOC113203417 [Frankliniella occidentalis]
MESCVTSASTFSTMVREFELEGNNALMVNSLLDALNEMVNTNILVEAEECSKRTFISSIGKLLSLVDCSSSLAWSILHVLEVYFNATVSDTTLKEVKKLTPMVSKLAVSALTDEKKVRLLKVLQTLTYGIKLLWPDSYTVPLFSSLIDWSKVGNQSLVVQLSLSVLSNLLHQNSVALPILMKTVNLKTFMNDLLHVRGYVECKMEVCKLMLLLGDLIYEKPEEEEIMNFIKVTLFTVLEATKCENRSRLQHCVSFFADSINSKKISVRNLHQPWIPESVCKVVDLLETGIDSMNPEIAMLLFKFLGILVPLKISTLSSFNSQIMKLGVGWVKRHSVKAGEATNTMYLILIHQSDADSSSTCGLNKNDLVSVFIPLLRNTPTSRDSYLFLTTLLNFFTVTLDNKLFSMELQSVLNKEVVELLLASIPPTLVLWNDYSALDHVVEMYVHLFVFVCKIGTSCCDNSWMKSYTLWLREQKVLSLLAVALMCGSNNLKSNVLSLICSAGFPGDCLALLAKAMADGGKGCLAAGNVDHPYELLRNPSPSSVSTLIEVKNVLRNVKNKEEIISADKILQFYEYTDNVNSDIQKSLLASLTKATEVNSLLEEKMYLANQISNQFREKFEKLRPEFEQVCAKYELANKTIQSYNQEIAVLKERLSQEVSTCQTTVQSLKETIQRQEKDLYESIRNLKSLKEQLLLKENILTSHQEELESLQMERNALKEKEEESQAVNSKLEKENVQLELLLKQVREKVAQLENDKIAREKEIGELQRIRDTVFEITGGRKKF